MAVAYGNAKLNSASMSVTVSGIQTDKALNMQIGDLTNVSSGSPANRQFIRGNGTSFENSFIQAGDLPTGQDVINLADGSVNNTKFQYIGDLTGLVQAQLNTKQVLQGSGLTGMLCAFDVAGQAVTSSILSSLVTTQGNTFNGEFQLVKTDTGSKISLVNIPNGISALNIADGSVGNVAFQYIANLSSDAQEQITARMLLQPTAVNSNIGKFLDGQLIDTGILSSTITIKGNTFNGIEELVQTDENGVIIQNVIPVGINFNKIGDGSVSNAQYAMLNSLSSNVQSQINTKMALQTAAIAGNIGQYDNTGQIVDSLITATSITIQGNTFNEANKLLQLNGAGFIPQALIPSNIPATKIADGSITDTEFQYLNGLGGNIQTQLDAKANKILNPVSGDFINVTALGDIQDSGISFSTDASFTSPSNTKIASQLATSSYIIGIFNLKMPTQPTAILNNLGAFNGAGEIVDSLISKSSVLLVNGNGSQLTNLTKSQVGLSNVVNLDTSDATNVLINGVFTPVNSVVLTGDSLRVATAKLQGQISGINVGVTSIASANSTITVNPSSGAVNLSLPQAIDASATVLFSTGTFSAGTNQISLGGTYKSVFNSTDLTAHRLVSLPNANSVTVIPNEVITGKFMVGIGADGVVTSTNLPAATNADIGAVYIDDTNLDININGLLGLKADITVNSLIIQDLANGIKFFGNGASYSTFITRNTLTQVSNSTFTIANGASTSVIVSTGEAGQWVSYIDADGVQILTNPAFSDIGGFLNANQISDGSVSDAEFNTLIGINSNIQNQINNNIGTLSVYTTGNVKKFNYNAKTVSDNFQQRMTQYYTATPLVAGTYIDVTLTYQAVFADTSFIPVPSIFVTSGVDKSISLVVKSYSVSGCVVTVANMGVTDLAEYTVQAITSGY